MERPTSGATESTFASVNDMAIRNRHVKEAVGEEGKR